MIWAVIYLLYFALGVQETFARGLYMGTLFTSMQFIVYTVNTRVLIPSYFEREKTKFYLLNFIFLLFSAVLATSADMLSISIAVFRPPNWEERPNIVFFPFFLHTVLCFVAFWISLARYLIEKEKKTKLEIGELRKEKAESELKFLKTQINPHFLFNALNNIYTMTYIRDNSASEKIAMLSDMLRYILYDCGSDFISLDKEIKYIRNYIEFQQLKTENKQNITFLCQAENGNYQLAPMLLIPFIENGFKHSRIEKESSAFVTIILSQNGEKLSFVVRNTCREAVISPFSPNGKGIGIENVQSRLKLLYPDKHNLEVWTDGQEHSVCLELHRTSQQATNHEREQ